MGKEESVNFCSTPFFVLQHLFLAWDPCLQLPSSRETVRRHSALWFPAPQSLKLLLIHSF